MKLTINEHDILRREMLAGLMREHDTDEIDEALDDMIQVDPYAGDPPSRRSDKETSRLLSILDSLETERGTH